MLLAYIDEIEQSGAFVSPDHKRFNDSPAFGYGGFVIPEEAARELGAKFAKIKQEAFVKEIKEAANPGRWEKKGADLLFAGVNEARPLNVRILASLFGEIARLGGQLFYYAEEKPLGTHKQVNTGPEEFRQREETAMRETLNRLARHADYNSSNILVMMDQINEKSRKQRLPAMYAHIYRRSQDFKEMRRIVEPPMHIDSENSTNIQLADWVCAFVKRAIDNQLVKDSRYQWIPLSVAADAANGHFTYESKLRLYERSISDFNHSQLIYPGARPMFVNQGGYSLRDDHIVQLERIRAAARTQK
ncbi:DUF3800 domain-containing protein [Corynebacterium riegelii]|uniref:DUF3800 domain-containing protein n=1 Tax=Corynebacterium riegelii TaxID=156976 RepID=UPI000C78579E|nr:DUF3800 domain-containing protein [Corynebacterium riegelii]PLA12623.1 DUF3800 domain-containing protein [Corynebacterium riegelii]